MDGGGIIAIQVTFSNLKFKLEQRKTEWFS